ncbi:MAG: GvpL/GvpF family gas vesicle protein [Pseudomonadota bacterium]
MLIEEGKWQNYYDWRLFRIGKIILKYLLYCIFRSRKNQMAADITGVDDQPVVLVENNGISAAISRIAHSDSPPDISHILAYKNVIESFHRDRTLIPMRYGCLLEEERQVVQLLKKNQAQYEALLKELGTCVEMGIRVLIEDLTNADCGLRNVELEKNNPKSKIQNPKCEDPQSSISGRQYIIERSAHYVQKDKSSRDIDKVINHYKEVFSGLYIKFTFEYNPDSSQSTINNQQSTIKEGLLSLYYLVPRQSVERFRRVFRRLCSAKDVKLLLSGPWPPFNFVLPDRAKGLTIVDC